MIGFRDFRKEDISGFIQNGYTLGLNMSDLPDLLNHYEIYTLEDNGKAVAIAAFMEYGERLYNGFLFISSDMTARHGVIIRKFIWDNIKKRDAIRLETTSIDCPKLNAWHDFLGFTCEGVRRKYYDGKDFRMWSIVDGH